MKMKIYIWRTPSKIFISYADSIESARKEIMTYYEQLTWSDKNYILENADQIIDSNYAEIFPGEYSD